MEIKLIKERDENLSFIEQILQNRGIDRTANDFFNLDWSCVNDPHNLDYMSEATKLYKKHIQNNSKIAVLVDVDMDGFSSAALLFNYTADQKKYGDWKESTAELVPVFHKNKTHGLGDKEMMRRLRDEIKPNLLVIPDASGTAEQYKALTDLGIDILVLDHHDMPERGDGEKVIVVNNQQSKNYTNKDLSGVGIVWQFCRALDEELSFINADEYLDLVAIGNVGDVMDLRSDETRFLCYEGLNSENLHSNFLNYLKFTSYSLQNKDYCPIVVSFNVAPLFNAVCRIGDMEEKEMLFKCLLNDSSNERVISGKRGHENEEVPLVEEGCRLASNARGRQNTRKDKLVGMINEVISKEQLFRNPVIVLGFDDFKDEYRDLTGLVAAGLSDYYDRPVIITFKNEDGSYSGSLRAPDKIPAYANFNDQCQASGLCTFVAGHQQAAGIGIKPDCIEQLNDYFKERYAQIDTSLCEKVDFVFDANDPELADLITELAKYNNIWGQNLEAPKIAITNVKMSPTTMTLCGAKKNTLKVSLPDIELINFNSSQAEYDSLKLPYEGVEQYYTATVIGHDPTLNEFRGNITPQLQFSTYELGEIKYDF